MAQRRVTTEQRAAVALEIEKVEADLAKERQGTRTDLVANLQQSKARAGKKAADQVGVSEDQSTASRQLPR